MPQGLHFEQNYHFGRDRPTEAVSGSNDQIAPAAKVRVAIVSAVRLVRESLTLNLRERDGIDVIDAVDLDPQEITRIATATPDVVLVDVGRTEPAAIGALFKVSCPKAKLVAFALAEVDEDVFACAAAGFSGYVPSDSGADELYRAMIGAANGHMHCAPHIAAAMFSRLSVLTQQQTTRAALHYSLTAREKEIMRLAEDGRSNKEIARQLRISTATVKNHIHNILQKMHVGRRGEAVAQLRNLRTA